MFIDFILYRYKFSLFRKFRRWGFSFFEFSTKNGSRALLLFRIGREGFGFSLLFLGRADFQMGQPYFQYEFGEY